MSEEKKMEEIEGAEDKAPAVPTSEPPKDDANTEEKPVETGTEAPAAEAKTEEIKEEKPKTRRRPTFKWGKNRDAEPKAPEPPKNPREEILGWIDQQIPQAVHKVNFHVLDWAQKMAIEDESSRQNLPGKDGMITRNQFLSFLRDGDLLTKLANKLQPGAIPPAVVAEPVKEEVVAAPTEVEAQKEDAPATTETTTDAPTEKKEEVKEEPVKEKDIQTKNVEAFVAWAKENLGLPEDKVMSVSDLLEKGKAGYPAVFQTLWQLGTKAAEKFEQQGVDVDAVVNAASAAVRSSIIQTIIGFFRRSRTAQPEKKEEEAMEETKDVTAQVVEKIDGEETKAETAPTAVCAQ